MPEPLTTQDDFVYRIYEALNNIKEVKVAVTTEESAVRKVSVTEAITHHPLLAVFVPTSGTPEIDVVRELPLSPTVDGKIEYKHIIEGSFNSYVRKFTPLRDTVYDAVQHAIDGVGRDLAQKSLGQLPAPNVSILITDARFSQGYINQPTGPVAQRFGNEINRGEGERRDTDDENAVNSENQTPTQNDATSE